MDTSENKDITKDNKRKHAISKQIDGISWALFFIMIGGIGLVPAEKVPQGVWLIGAGLIMLGNNLFRYIKGIKVVGFTIVLGILALMAGLSDFLGFDIPLFPVLLILVGLSIILGLFSSKK